MKHKMFNIRNINKNTLYEQSSPQKIRSLQDLSHSQGPTQNQFSQFLSMFQSFLKSTDNKQEKEPKHFYQVQARDRQVIIPLPQLIENKIPASDLKTWISKVVKLVCSSAFNYFFKKQMSYEQTKIFCSQNILKNIVYLSQLYTLSAEQIQLIDCHIKNNVLSYLSAKYPLTDSSEINKKLEQVVKQVDNTQEISYNYFTNSKIVFQYRQSGNYNDLIMRVINDLMETIDQETIKQKNVFQDFKQMMSSLFEKVEDQDWMRKEEQINQARVVEETRSREYDLQKMRKREQEKQRYRNMVKQYTHYLIGRKISENTAKYSENEINQNMVIKSPTILRILTKWCQQLQQKYKNNYFSSRSQSVKVERGQNINSLLAWMRRSIDFKLDQQSKRIDIQMKELFKNNYQMQSIILEREVLSKGDQFIEQVEKVSGKFSNKMVSIFHTYIIAYLNNLIHGLLKVSKEIYEQNNLSNYSFWPSPPNLLSFKIGDLMRCKCSSKQRQIINIYKQLQKMSIQNPQKLKIIRIKNRLRSGTNDILINIRMNNLITCEIQLAIKSKVSDFIQCSNLFHHYLYQLERSIFGTITQLCSIWNSLDQRTNIYTQLVQSQQTKEFTVHSCTKFDKKFQMISHNRPFICSCCSQTYFNNNYIQNHKKCTICSFVICAHCSLDQHSQEELKNQLITSPQLRKICISKISMEDQIPTFGVCILIEAKEIKEEIFTLVIYQKKKYLLARKGQEIYEICKINTRKQMNNFMKKYIVFIIEQNQNYSPIQQKQARNKYILPSAIKINFRKQKESINLMDLSLTTKQCESILCVGTKAQKQKIKNVFLVDNKIKEFPFNPYQFPNIQWLTLSRNASLSFKQFPLLKNLKKLVLVSCKLKTFPSQLYDCNYIEQLSLASNQISEIDKRILNFKQLISLQLNDNSIKEVPQQLFQCKPLKILKFDLNQLEQIHENIGQLINLQVLTYSYNKIMNVSDKIGDLQELKELRLGFNVALKSIPSSIAGLKKIEILDITATLINQIPISTQGWPNLKQLRMQDTKIKTLTESHLNSTKLNILITNHNPSLQLLMERNTYVKTFEATSMEWNQIPSCVFKMGSLQHLKLSYNKLSSDLTFQSFLDIQTIALNDCQLHKMPNFSGCTKLKKLDLSRNSITQIPNHCLNNLRSLQQFICNNNFLTHISSAMIRLPMLTKLDLDDNAITSFFDLQTERKVKSESIGWPNLTDVNLSTNKLQSIPMILCYSSKIQRLLIQNNQLMSIPPQIKNMTMLKDLQLIMNQIKQIPYEIGQLSNLRSASLFSNKITKIVGSIQKLKNLQTFTVDNEYIEEIECLEWMLGAKGIDFNGLEKIAYRMKYGKQQEQVEPEKADQI